MSVVIIGFAFLYVYGFIMLLIAAINGGMAWAYWSAKRSDVPHMRLAAHRRDDGTATFWFFMASSQVFFVSVIAAMFYILT